ncbi:MAG: glucosyltransferase, partial [Methylobacterium sp.]
MDLTSLTAWISPLLLLVAVAGCVYALMSAVMAGRFARRAVPVLPEGTARPSVTILKPLCGMEPNLYANLESFCRQNYAG